MAEERPVWTAIVVTYNSAGIVADCLDSLAPDALEGRARVVVVNNASSDDTAGIIADRYPWAVLVRSPVNGGFGAGCNLGLMEAAGEYCLLLNPDVILAKGCAEELVAFMDQHPDAGLVGPAIMDTMGRLTLSHFPFTGLMMSLWIALGLQRILPLNRSGGAWELRRRPLSTTVEVDRLLGAAMMVRRSALDRTGAFDERFFLYSEEDDLCRRLRDDGWKVYYHPDARVRHHGAGSTGDDNPLAVASADWSRYLLLLKHRGRAAAELSRWVWVVMLTVRLLGGVIACPFSGGGRIAGYRLSLRSLLDRGYFERVLRPARTLDGSVDSCLRRNDKSGLRPTRRVDPSDRDDR